MDSYLVINFYKKVVFFVFFFFQAEDGIRDVAVTGVQTCALPICCRNNFDTKLAIEVQ